MLIISGRVRLRSDRIPAALEAAGDMARRSRAEAGCAAYDFGIDVEDGTVVRIFEQWESAEALATHFATEHFAAFGAVIGDVLDGEATFTRYEVSSAGPLFG